MLSSGQKGALQLADGRQVISRRLAHRDLLLLILYARVRLLEVEGCQLERSPQSA